MTHSEFLTKSIETLRALECIDTQEGRKLLLATSEFDEQLRARLSIHGTPAEFLGAILSTLMKYGRLSSGEDPVVALLRSFRLGEGEDGRGRIQELIDDWERLCPTSTRTKRPSRVWLERNGRILIVASGGGLILITFFVLLSLLHPPILLVGRQGGALSGSLVARIEGRLLEFGTSDFDRSPLEGVTVTLLETGESATTTKNGLFTINLRLPMNKGHSLTLVHDKSGYVIVNLELLGRFRIPAEGDLLEFWLLPKGSKASLSDKLLGNVVKQLTIHSLSKSLMAGASPNEEYREELRIYCEQVGLSEEEVSTRLMDWSRRIGEPKTKGQEPSLEESAWAGVVGNNYELSIGRLKDDALRKTGEAATLFETLGDVSCRFERYPEAVSGYENAIISLERNKTNQFLTPIKLKYANAQLRVATTGSPDHFTKAIKAAIATYEDQVRYLTSKADSQMWVEVQANLAVGLYTFGLQSNDPELLTKAEEVNRELLKRIDKRNSPRDWALTQINLAVAIAVLAQRTSPETGVLRLKEAQKLIMDSQHSLKELNLQMDLARADNNLGQILVAEAQISSDADAKPLLEQSVSAHRRALEALSPKDNRSLWAMTQAYLGTALYGLSQRSSPPGEALKLLEAAMKAQNIALDAIDRDLTPQGWAYVQYNLGVSLFQYWNRTKAITRLEESERALRESLKVYTAKQFPKYWVMAQSTWGHVLLQLGDASPGRNAPIRLRESEVALSSVLAVLTKKDDSDLWVSTKENLGRVLCALSIETGDRSQVERGVSCYHDVLKVLSKDESPKEWPILQFNLGNALRTEASMHRGDDRRRLLVEAETCADSASESFRKQFRFSEVVSASVGKRVLELELALEDHDWNKAEALSKSLADSLKVVPAERYYCSALFCTGKFDDCINNCRKLLAKVDVDVETNGRTVVEIQMLQAFCFVALGDGKEAMRRVEMLCDFLAMKPYLRFTNSSWICINEYIATSASEAILTRRGWLLKANEALLLKDSDRMLDAMRQIPDLR